MSHDRNHDRTHKSVEERAHSIYSFASNGQTDKLLEELNATKPKELSKLAARLQEEASKKANKDLPEVKITQQADTKEGGSLQPIQLSFEGDNKVSRAQVFSYDVLKHKWYHSDLDEKARKIELYAADQSPSKVIETLNSIKPKDFSDLERKLNEQTSHFTLGSESFPKVEATRNGPTEGGMQPVQFALDNKSDYHAHVYEYDALKHTWKENKHASDRRSLQRLGSNWQLWLHDTKHMFGQAGKEFASGSDKCYRFFIKMEGVTKSLESISGGSSENK
ncbi:MAG: hypothetical protein K2Y22_13830 [Candidatus Obscuribacterales bacterium]|nr:hypothetical protein [Candidatus Obscuribacterales bacterium]